MKPYLFLMFCWCCMACNAGRKIVVENKTKSDVEIVWVIKEDSIHQSPLYISNSDVVKLTIHENSPRKKMTFTVGSGSWTPAVLNSFADDLHSMQLKWNTGFIKLDSSVKIVDFLRIRRKGIDNSVIHIVMK